MTRALCTEFGLDESTAGEVELVVVEAATNCIEHAYAGDSTQHVALRFEFLASELVITIEDTGRPMPSRLMDDASLPPDGDLSEGGRGLFLIKSLMSAVSYQSQDTVNRLRLSKSISRAL
jgi:serine/threonine-protein kinase RsbW